MKRLALLGLAAALASSPAAAQTLLNDTFNAEHGGTSQLNYHAFANWSVIGQVDLVKSGDFGISCGGMCVDLDGSSGPGTMASLQNFTFGSGDIMRFTFDVSGNQRDGNSDLFVLGLNFTGNTMLASYLGTGGFASISSGPTLLSGLTAQSAVAGNAPFSTWSLQFQAIDAGAVQLLFGTSSGDNVGPLLDNVVVERISTIVTPEPSTWAMLAFGLGSVGFVSRRRARKS